MVLDQGRTCVLEKKSEEFIVPGRCCPHPGEPPTRVEKKPFPIVWRMLYIFVSSFLQISPRSSKALHHPGSSSDSTVLREVKPDVGYSVSAKVTKYLRQPILPLFVGSQGSCTPAEWEVGVLKSLGGKRASLALEGICGKRDVKN